MSIRLTLVVVGEVVPLHLGHVLGQPGVVEGVVHAVVEDVEGERAGDDPVGDPRWEENVCEAGERRLEGEEQQRWHDQPESVHGQVMVDPVEQEMEHESPVPVGQVVVDVEEEAVERVLEDSPDHVAEEEACEGLGERRGVRDGQGREREREQVRGGDGFVGELEDRQGEEERRDGSPDQRHDIPLGTRESLLGSQ